MLPGSRGRVFPFKVKWIVVTMALYGLNSYGDSLRTYMVDNIYLFQFMMIMMRGSRQLLVQMVRNTFIVILCILIIFLR